MTHTSPSSRVDNIRHSLVGLRMPRALEMLDATLRRIEQGQIDGVEALDELLTEELSLRENRRIRAALRMARLPVVKTLAGFDFAFQPSLDRNRIMALAGLDFIARAEVIHLLGPPGTGKRAAPDAHPLDRGKLRDEHTECGSQPADKSLINRRLPPHLQLCAAASMNYCYATRPAGAGAPPRRG